MIAIRLTAVICLWGLLCQGGFAQKTEPGQTGLSGPYLGQPTPGKEPKIFAPGIVSQTGNTVSACTFSSDGLEFYFTNQTNCHIMFSRLTEQGWTSPAVFQVSSSCHAFEPHVTRDNKRIYWNWDNPKQPGPSVYYAERRAEGWSEPQYAGPGMFLSSSRDGQMYGTHLGSETDFVGRAVMEGNRITGYEDLEGEIEKIRSRSNSVAHPCIAPDGTYILFDIEGGHHLFVSFKGTDGTWSEAIDLALHGLDVKAGMASITPDGQYLFFSQDGNIHWVSTQLIEELK